MKTSKLFIAGALAITSLSFASCSQDEPATTNPTAQTVMTTKQDIQWPSHIHGYTLFCTKKNSLELDVLNHNTFQVNEFEQSTNVVTTGDELAQCDHAKDILRHGGFLIVTNATGAQIYNWMQAQDWEDMPGITMCPDSFKNSEVTISYTLFGPKGYIETVGHDIDAIAKVINSSF